MLFRYGWHISWLLSNYKKEILHLCKNLSELSYRETKEIFVQDALLRDDFYNSWVSCRINANNLKKMID